jgi:hypothetical protein
MLPSMEEANYSTGEAGKILAIDTRRVRQLLKAGELEGTRDPKTGHWRVYQRSVHARMNLCPASREAPPSSAPPPSEPTDLEHQVSAINARLERLEERVEAGLELERRRADLERRWADLQRERAELLERKLEAERSKGGFRKLFGG